MTRIALVLLVCALSLNAAVPTFQSFESTQFDTNLMAIKYRSDWTNELGVLRPATVNTELTFTNLNLYETFVLPAKVVSLTLGTNELNVATNSTWLLYSPTNDAAQVTLSLSAGKFQGQLLFITSQNGDGAFILPDGSEQYDVPGALVDMQGDWTGTTNRGVILQYTAPDWIEMARFEPGSTNGPFGGALWSEAGGTISPNPAANVSTGTGTLSIGSLTNLLLASGAHLIYTNQNTGLVAFQIHDGAGMQAHMSVSGNVAQFKSSGSALAVELADSTSDSVRLGFDLFRPIQTNIVLGAYSDQTWLDVSLSRNIVWNGSTNSLFDSWGSGSPEGVKTARLGSLYRDTTNGDIYKKASGTGNTGWSNLASSTFVYPVAASDETTAIAAGTAKVTFRMPFACTLTAVRASLTTDQASGSIFTVDINEAGTTILSTKLTIDNTEKTSVTAATPPVISDTAIADDAEMTIDVDQIGASGASGLKVEIYGYK